MALVCLHIFYLHFHSSSRDVLLAKVHRLDLLLEPATRCNSMALPSVHVYIYIYTHMYIHIHIIIHSRPRLAPLLGPGGLPQLISIHVHQLFDGSALSRTSDREAR